MISSKQRGITRVIETGCMPGLLLPDHVSTCGGIADLRRLKPPLCIKGGIFMQKNSLTVYIEAGLIATLAFIISLFPIEGTGFDIALGSIPITLFLSASRVESRDIYWAFMGLTDDYSRWGFNYPSCASGVRLSGSFCF